VDELLNGHRLERAGDVLAPDFVGYFPGTPAPVRGVNGWRQNLGGFLAAFPDYAETLEDLIVEDGAAAARITFGGTHRGGLLGIPPTGKRVEVGGMAILHVRAGKLAAQWAAADMLGLLQQLAVMPAPSPATG
jgi:predicted ester cyclase